MGSALRSFARSIRLFSAALISPLVPKFKTLLAWALVALVVLVAAAIFLFKDDGRPFASKATVSGDDVVLTLRWEKCKFTLLWIKRAGARPSILSEYPRSLHDPAIVGSYIYYLSTDLSFKSSLFRKSEAGDPELVRSSSAGIWYSLTSSPDGKKLAFLSKPKSLYPEPSYHEIVEYDIGSDETRILWSGRGHLGVLHYRVDGAILFSGWLDSPGATEDEFLYRLNEKGLATPIIPLHDASFALSISDTMAIGPFQMGPYAAFYSLLVLTPNGSERLLHKSGYFLNISLDLKNARIVHFFVDRATDSVGTVDRSKARVDVLDVESLRSVPLNLPPVGVEGICLYPWRYGRNNE